MFILITGTLRVSSKSILWVLRYFADMHPDKHMVTCLSWRRGINTLKTLQLRQTCFYNLCQTFIRRFIKLFIKLSCPVQVFYSTLYTFKSKLYLLPQSKGETDMKLLKQDEFFRLQSVWPSSPTWGIWVYYLIKVAEVGSEIHACNLQLLHTSV